MDIVFASHTYMGGHFVVGSHHLARELARAGHRVAHVSTPLTPFHLLALRLEGPIRDRFRTWRRNPGPQQPGEPTDIVPMAVLPWQATRTLRRLGLNPAAWMVPGPRKLLARIGMGRPDLLVIDQPRMAGIETALRARATIYRATDLYAELEGDASCVLAERQILEQADGWIATSGPVHDHLARIAPRKPSLLIENGVDLGHFTGPQAMPAEYGRIPAPRLVYVGALDDRFDGPAAQALARELPDASVIVIGPAERGVREALDAHGQPNLHVLGPRRYADLPAYLQHARAGLILLNDHPANAGRSPMKLYEYAAAGLPVVCRRTPEIARRAEPFVFTYDRLGEVADAARAALERRDFLESALAAAAAAASWTAKASRIESFALGLMSALPRSAPAGGAGQATPAGFGTGEHA